MFLPEKYILNLIQKIMLKTTEYTYSLLLLEATSVGNLQIYLYFSGSIAREITKEVAIKFHSRKYSRMERKLDRNRKWQ